MQKIILKLCNIDRPFRVAGKTAKTRGMPSSTLYAAKSPPDSLSTRHRDYDLHREIPC
jgi:hypothetical protein